MQRSNLQLPEEVTPIMISKANFELLLREGRSFEEYFRFKEEADIQAVEDEIIGEEMQVENLDNIPEDPDNIIEQETEDKPEESDESNLPEITNDTEITPEIEILETNKFSP